MAHSIISFSVKNNPNMAFPKSLYFDVFVNYKLLLCFLGVVCMKGESEINYDVIFSIWNEWLLAPFYNDPSK